MKTSAKDTWLNITFEGLCLFEIHDNRATVHFIDGVKAGIPRHLVVLEALHRQVVSTTLDPAPSHIIHVAAGTQAWTVDPVGPPFEITGPFNDGSNTLRFAGPNPPAASRRDLAQRGPGDPAWDSLDWVADLRRLCGATGIKPHASFLGRMELTQGMLQSRPPTGSVGTVEWIFSNPKTRTTLQQQVLTNSILCSCPIGDREATIKVGPRELVLRRVDSLGPAISLFVRSLPETPQKLGIALTTPLKIDDFNAYLSVVSASFTPEITSVHLPNGVGGVVGRQGGDIEPVLCPPAQMRAGSGHP